MTKTIEDVVGMRVNKKLRKGVVKREGIILEVPEGEQVDYVNCSYCQAPHIYESGTYVELIGNLHSGEGGGLLGNPDWKEHGVPASYYCVDSHCLSKCILENEHHIKDSNNGVYLREGETLQVLRGRQVGNSLLLSGSNWVILKKRHDGVALALLNVYLERDTSEEKVIVPRDAIREWFKEGKVELNTSKRP